MEFDRSRRRDAETLPHCSMPDAKVPSRPAQQAWPHRQAVAETQSRPELVAAADRAWRDAWITWTDMID